jgi:SAM-dependent methyltransferase
MFSVEYLNELRAAELERIVRHLHAGARVLEIGAGTGRQALELQRRGFDVAAIEMPDSDYVQHRIFPITDYDGRHIPFGNRTFDIVFSSNVMEHVPDLTQIHAEIRRVLKPDGYCVHVLPTSTWRFWTTLSGFLVGVQRAVTASSAPRVLRCLAAPFFQRRHGVRGNLWTELWFFRPGWWRANFRSHGFVLALDEPVGLFYTGHLLFGPRLSLAQRESWAQALGSACHLFKLRVAPTADAS